MIETQEFAGASKVNTSFLTPFERRLAPRILPRIPAWLETYHLTMLTLVWSSLILLFSYFAARNLRWLWGVSAMIAMQYITDHYDGKVGKYRGTGLVRWGYYMDHLLDYYFLCSVIIGYAFILPESGAHHHQRLAGAVRHASDGWRTEVREYWRRYWSRSHRLSHAQSYLGFGYGAEEGANCPKSVVLSRKNAPLSVNCVRFATVQTANEVGSEEFLSESGPFFAQRAR